jgi:hypothetical protein
MSGQKIFENFIDQYFLNHWGMLVYASATGWLALNIVTTYFPSAPKITNFPNKEKKERGLIEKTVAIVASVIVFGGGVILVSRLLTMQKELTKAETQIQGLVDQIHTVFHDTLKCWSPSVALVRNDTNAVVKVHAWHSYGLSVAGKVYEVPPDRFQVVEGNGLSRGLGQGLIVRVANGPEIFVRHNEICTVSELLKRES